MTKFFEPDSSVRQLDLKKWVGKTLVITLGHTDKSIDKKLKKPTKQYANAHVGDHAVSGWIDYVGKSDEKVKRTVSACYFIEHNNGGRSNSVTATSYKAFFNNERKKHVMKYLADKVDHFFGQRGDPDEAEIVVEFEEGGSLSGGWAISCPEEWYSELHRDNPKFRFSDGFYPNADAAVETFSNKCHDDLFGERYFPLIVIDKKSKQINKLREIASQAKNHSKAIATDKYVIFGTRCKSYEFGDVIRNCYEIGGLVPVGVEWDWE